MQPKICLIICSCFLITAKMQAQYMTPWWGYLGLQTNVTKYEGSGSSIKAPLTYVDTRAVYANKKYYVEWGMPVVSYFLTKIITTGNLSADNGEVSYIYTKGGFNVLNLKYASIGLGASFDARGIATKGIPGYGASLQSYGTLNPMVYAKFGVQKLSIMPIVEWNAITFSNADATRPGITLSANIVLPITKGLGIDISPIVEKGTFKGTTTMSSKNLALKVGFVKMR